MAEHSQSAGIVFVDDGADFLDSCNALFGNEGHVKTFETAEETMEYTRSLEEPTIFFIDMKLKHDGDGIKLIRNIIAVARAPVICYCLSGNADPMQKYIGLSSGANGYITKPCHRDEIDGYIAVAERYFLSLFNASRDHLTGLLNRRAFEKMATRELGPAMRWGRSTVCLFIDLDKFKEINDTHSHSVGDSVLQVVATCLNAHPWRSSDVVCRYGGDEFVILLPEISKEEAERLASDLKEAVSNTDIKNSAGEVFHITMSVGIAELDFKNSSRDVGLVLNDLIERSDQDLKRVKKNR